MDELAELLKQIANRTSGQTEVRYISLASCDFKVHVSTVVLHVQMVFHECITLRISFTDVSFAMNATCARFCHSVPPLICFHDEKWSQMTLGAGSGPLLYAAFSGTCKLYTAAIPCCQGWS